MAWLGLDKKETCINQRPKVLKPTTLHRRLGPDEETTFVCFYAHLLYPVMRMVAGSGSLMASINCSNSPAGTRPSSW